MHLEAWLQDAISSAAGMAAVESFCHSPRLTRLHREKQLLGHFSDVKHIAEVA